MGQFCSPRIPIIWVVCYIWKSTSFSLSLCGSEQSSVFWYFRLLFYRSAQTPNEPRMMSVPSCFEKPIIGCLRFFCDGLPLVGMSLFTPAEIFLLNGTQFCFLLNLLTHHNVFYKIICTIIYSKCSLFFFSKCTSKGICPKGMGIMLLLG